MIKTIDPPKNPKRLCGAGFFGSLLMLLGFVTAAPPALADSTFSASLGEAVLFSSSARSIGGSAQFNAGAALDLNNAKGLVLKNSLLFDYASGSANGGSLNDWGIGFGTRLNTPLYVGAAGFVYNVNANQGPGIGSHSVSGFGSNLFVGEHLFGLPGGAGVGAQLTYRQVPVVNGINPSGLAFALRLSL